MNVATLLILSEAPTMSQNEEEWVKRQWIEKLERCYIDMLDVSEFITKKKVRKIDKRREP